MDDSLTIFAVRVSSAASTQAVAEYDRLTTTADRDIAEEWRERLQSTLSSLATLPLRCPVAPEDAVFQESWPGPPLRQLLFRRGRSGLTWRILFTARTATADDPPLIQVYQIRRGAQAPLTQWPIEED